MIARSWFALKRGRVLVGECTYSCESIGEGWERWITGEVERRASNPREHAESVREKESERERASKREWAKALLA